MVIKNEKKCNAESMRYLNFMIFSDHLSYQIHACLRHLKIIKILFDLIAATHKCVKRNL